MVQAHPEEDSAEHGPVEPAQKVGHLPLHASDGAARVPEHELRRSLDELRHGRAVEIEIGREELTSRRGPLAR
jgi:hypothetical protein